MVISMPDLELIALLARNAIEAASAGREAADIGPFRGLFSLESDLFYLNYAVPMHPGQALEDWLPRLEDAFRARKRRPRFEYFPALWPSLAPLLEARGYQLEHAAPCMAVTAQQFIPQPTGSAELYQLTAETADEVYAAFCLTGQRGFEQELMEPLEVAVKRTRAQVTAGAHLGILAWMNGEPVAVASLLPSGELAELAGVACLPAWRRQGIAGAVCSGLLAEGFARGLSRIWLSAGSYGAMALYSRLGFQWVGEQRFYSIPPVHEGHLAPDAPSGSA